MGETDLKAAYYGPPIPPQNSYYRPGHRPGCCGPCCLLGCLFKILATLLVVIGIVILVVWLVLRPQKISVHVERASLTQFNLTSNGVLHYTLSLDISIRNPNRKVAIYYDRLEASALFRDQRFGYLYLPPFFQGRRNTTVLHLDFRGQQLLSTASDEFNSEKQEGWFEVEVQIHSKIRLKIGSLKTNHYTPEADCDVTVPLITGRSTGSTFPRTTCDIDF